MVDGIKGHWQAKEGKDGCSTLIPLSPEIIHKSDQWCFYSITGPESWILNGRDQDNPFHPGYFEAAEQPPGNWTKMSRHLGSTNGFLRRRWIRASLKCPENVPSCSEEFIIAWVHLAVTILSAFTNQEGQGLHWQYRELCPLIRSNRIEPFPDNWARPFSMHLTWTCTTQRIYFPIWLPKK